MKAGSVPPIVYEKLRNFAKQTQQAGNKREKLQNEPKVLVAGRGKIPFSRGLRRRIFSFGSLVIHDNRGTGTCGTLNHPGNSWFKGAQCAAVSKSDVRRPVRSGL